MATELVEKLKKDEIVVLDKATDEFFVIGYSSCVCPRCGNGFDFSQKGTSYQIKCKTDGCIKITSRGI